jgi:site-specific DNA-methyltransferase (adenine-specific)
MDLILGDCLEKMKNIPDHSIDMILCDLPFGTTKCRWDVLIPFELLWSEYERITKCNGAIVLFGTQPFTSKLILSNLKLFKYEVIWHKDKPADFVSANKRIMKYHENICIFYNKQPTYNPQKIPRKGSGAKRSQYLAGSRPKDRSDHGNQITDGKMYDPNLKNPESILFFNTGRRNDYLHPTQKPMALCEYLIKTYTNENDLVLDNCMGSGTAAIAALNTNRQFIGIEKDTNYFDLAKRRIESHIANQHLNNNKES